GSVCDSYNVGLGFVCDPDKDGWTVGTPYPYYGDYFLPGVPQEGWSIMADGVQANSWNGYGCDSLTPIMDSAITGSNISYTDTGSKRITVWQGMYDSILITQETTLDTANTYFNVKTTLK